jgi:carboxylesterase
MIIPSAEPFFFPGRGQASQAGCLLVHGFTGTPKEMRWMGEWLAGQGHAVLGVRLAGHATRLEDLPRTRWQDWLASLEDGWHLLSGCARQIVVMGLSMGGALALLFAARRYQQRCPIAGVVAMSTIYALPSDPRLPYIQLLAHLQPSVSKGPSDWRDLEAAQDHIDYPVYPTRAVAELRDLLVELRACLPEVQAPVLFIHSRSDGSVPPEQAKLLSDRVGSLDKQTLWVENSGHVIVREPERLRVFEAAGEFVRRVTAV